MVLVVVFLSLNMPRLVLGIIEVRISLEQYVLPMYTAKEYSSFLSAKLLTIGGAKLFTMVGFAGTRTHEGCTIHYTYDIL